MKLNAIIKTLHPRNVFRISRSARDEVRNVFVEVTADGVTGRGEASPNPYYDETALNVMGLLKAVQPFVANLKIGSVSDIERAWRESWRWFAPSRAAQCALNLALWDWLARREGITVSELAFGHRPEPVTTFCTIGISSNSELMAKAAELRGFPQIKIKSDSQADLETIAYVRRITGASLAVDANGAWGGVNLAETSQKLTSLGVLFIEQPLPPAQNDQMSKMLAASALPIMADESCVILEDVEEVPGRFSGFNIKLVKCGGLTPALAMLSRGKELGLQTMVGCMLESSLLISAGAVVAQQTDYADLDGAWLLKDDPYEGMPLQVGVLVPGGGLGFGVELKTAQ